MSKIGNLLYNIKEYFINEEDRKTSDNYRKGTMFVYSMLFFFGVTPFTFIGSILSNNLYEKYVSFFTWILLLVTLSFYKKVNSRILIINFTVFAYFSAIYYCRGVLKFNTLSVK